MDGHEERIMHKWSLTVEGEGAGRTIRGIREHAYGVGHECGKAVGRKEGYEEGARDTKEAAACGCLNWRAKYHKSEATFADIVPVVAKYIEARHAERTHPPAEPEKRTYHYGRKTGYADGHTDGCKQVLERIRAWSKEQSYSHGQVISRLLCHLREDSLPAEQEVTDTVPVCEDVDTAIGPMHPRLALELNRALGKAREAGRLEGYEEAQQRGKEAYAVAIEYGKKQVAAAVKAEHEKTVEDVQTALRACSTEDEGRHYLSPDTLARACAHMRTQASIKYADRTNPPPAKVVVEMTKEAYDESHPAWREQVGLELLDPQPETSSKETT